jgi:hypothetical protein
MTFEVVSISLQVLLVAAALVLLAYMLLSKRAVDPHEEVWLLAKQGDRVARLYYLLATAAVINLVVLLAKIAMFGKSIS